MTCGGVGRVAHDRRALPSGPGSSRARGSVSARYELWNQKCRASDVNSARRVPVATTTRSARSVPPAVVTSTPSATERDLRRPAIARTGARRDRRPRRPGRARRDTDRASPRRGSKAGATGDARPRPRRARVDQRPRRDLRRAAPSARARSRAACSGSSRRTARRGSRSHLMFEPPDERGEIERRAAPRLPRLARGAPAERLLRLRRSGRRARRKSSRPTIRCCRVPADCRFEQRHLDAGRGKRVGRCAPGEAAADDHDAVIEWPRWRGYAGTRDWETGRARGIGRT